MPLSPAPSGLQQMPFVETVPFTAVAATAAPGANFLCCVRMRVAKPITVSNITVWVGTSGGNLDVGIYSSDGTTLTKIASSGSTAVGTVTTAQVVPLTAAVQLIPGVDYYFALIVDSTSQFGRAAALINALVGLVDKMSVTKVQTFPLPGSPTLASLSSGLASVFWLRAS